MYNLALHFPCIYCKFKLKPIQFGMLHIFVIDSLTRSTEHEELRTTLGEVVLESGKAMGIWDVGV